MALMGMEPLLAGAQQRMITNGEEREQWLIRTAGNEIDRGASPLGFSSRSRVKLWPLASGP